MAVVGWALLGLLGLLLLLLCIPVRFGASYQTDEPPSAWVGWFCLNYDLTKAGEDDSAASKKAKKPKKSKKPKEKKTEKPEKPTAEKTPLEFSEQLGLVVDLLHSLGGGAGILLRNFRLYRLRLRMVVTGEDAAETAITYGKVNTAVYTAYALALNFLRIGRPEIEIRPDFVADKPLVEFEAAGRLTPLVAVAAGVRIGFAFLVKTIKRKNKTSESPPSEQSADKPAQ